jgi:hypothetical protein
MANEKAPVPGSRGERVDQIRKALGVNREEFAELVAAKAAELGVATGGKWTPTRVSKLILGRQPISLDDAVAVIALDPEERGWLWFAFGERKANRLVPDTRKKNATAARAEAKGR